MSRKIEPLTCQDGKNRDPNYCLLYDLRYTEFAEKARRFPYVHGDDRSVHRHVILYGECDPTSATCSTFCQLITDRYNPNEKLR